MELKLDVICWTLFVALDFQEEGEKLYINQVGLIAVHKIYLVKEIFIEEKLKKSLK